MSPLDVADNNAANTQRASSAYVPPLQRTEGQPPPVAAHGGLSYMSFDRDGDAGTAAAIQDAVAEIAEGEGQRVRDMVAKAPPGPIKTKWGLGFRDYDECMKYIRQSNSLKAPPGGVALPLPYTVYERPTYSIVPSNAIWRDPERADMAAILRTNEQGNRRQNLYFPQVLRDARRIGEYYPGLSPSSPECMDKLGLSLAYLESKCTNIYDAAEVERVYYPEIEKLLLDFFPDATDALVYNHDVFDKDYTGDRTEDQDSNNPGVNANYANLVHNDLNDNSGHVRCRELLTRDEQGRVIPAVVRDLFRTEIEPWLKAGAARGDAAVDYCNQPSPDVLQSPVPITRLMFHIWRRRLDLQSACNLTTADGRGGLDRWFHQVASHQLKLDAAYLAGVSTVAVPAALGETGVQTAGNSNMISRSARRVSSLAAVVGLNLAPRLRSVYRYLPQGIRTNIRTRLLHQADVAPLPPRETAGGWGHGLRPPGVNLVGYVRAELGVGEGLRCMARALDVGGIDFRTRELNVDHIARCNDLSFADTRDSSMPFDITIYHVNADRMPLLPLELEADKLNRRCRIGYWAWELERFPEAFHLAFDFVDEVWVPSCFVQRAVADASPVPVLVVPHAIARPAAVRPDRAPEASPNCHW